MYVHVLYRGVGFGREGGEIAGGRPVPLPFGIISANFHTTDTRPKEDLIWLEIDIEFHLEICSKGHLRCLDLKKKNICFFFGGGGGENVPGYRARCSNV